MTGAISGALKRLRIHNKQQDIHRPLCEHGFSTWKDITVKRVWAPAERQSCNSKRKRWYQIKATYFFMWGFIYCTNLLYVQNVTCSQNTRKCYQIKATYFAFKKILCF